MKNQDKSGYLNSGEQPAVNLLKNRNQLTGNGCWYKPTVVFYFFEMGKPVYDS